MAPNADDPETEKLAPPLVEHAREGQLSQLDALAACRQRWSELPRLDDRSAEEILGYGEKGLLN